MKRKQIIKEIPLHIFMMLLAAACIIPFIILISSSLEDEAVLLSQGYSLIPRKVSSLSYQYIFTGSAGKILRSYGISILVTVIGTFVSVMITAMFAYPMSRPELPGRGLAMLFLIIPMLFNGGLVPSYMMWTQMFHIKNTIFALLIPNLMMSAFYVIIMRTSFMTNIPRELIEATQVDGASELTIFFKVILPLSKPIIATVAFMTALGYWNDWMNGLYYITDANYYSIQNVLNRMLNDAQFLTSSEGAQMASMNGVTVPSTGIRMAIAVTGMLPVLLAFPFVQKYLVKGITLGAVKG